MRDLVCFLTLLVLLSFMVANTLAQDLVVYPAQGQSQEQMERDKFECYQWAKQQSGFDPMEQPKATTPPPQQEAPKGGVVRGAVGGAAVGAVVGGIADGKKGARKGAGAGAAGGALVGGMRRQEQRRQQQHQEQQWAEQQAAQYAQQRDAYNRAYAACLEGKGYTVK
jgi:hypothetical protein